MQRRVFLKNCVLRFLFGGRFLGAFLGLSFYISTVFFFSTAIQGIHFEQGFKAKKKKAHLLVLANRHEYRAQNPSHEAKWYPPKTGFCLS